MNNINNLESIVQSSIFEADDLDHYLITLASYIENKQYVIKTVRVYSQRYDDAWKDLAQYDFFTKILVNCDYQKDTYTEEELLTLQADKKCCILQVPNNVYHKPYYQFYTINSETYSLDFILQENCLTYLNDFIKKIIKKRRKNETLTPEELYKLCYAIIFRQTTPVIRILSNFSRVLTK